MTRFTPPPPDPPDYDPDADDAQVPVPLHKRYTIEAIAPPPPTIPFRAICQVCGRPNFMDPRKTLAAHQECLGALLVQGLDELDAADLRRLKPKK